MAIEIRISKTPLLTLASFVILFNVSCKEELPDLGKVEYVIKNTSQVNVGFKVRITSGSNASVVNDLALIKPGEEIVAINSHVLQEPDLIIDFIEIWDSEFKKKYKDIDLTKYVKENDRFIFILSLPNVNTSEIIKFNSSVYIYMNPTHIYGFYPKVDYPRTTYFFSTTNFFEDIFKTQTPTGSPNSDFRMADVFGLSMIGYDSWSYSGKALFIKSTNGGLSWGPFFEFGLDTGNDTFMGSDFVSVDKGWLINYKIVFNGQYANTYATDVYQYNAGDIQMLSTIDNYCVQVCKFIDEDVGYVLANSSNNVLPSDMSNTFFLKTTDGGVTWSDPVLISDSHTPSKIFRLSSGKLIVFMMTWNSMGKNYFVSMNDGETWQTENVAINDNIRDVFFLESGTGYIKTGSSGAWISQNIGDVYKTVNGGETWTKQTEQISGSSIWFYDEDIGYVQDLIYGKGQVLYTTMDGGLNWREVLYPYDYLIE